LAQRQSDRSELEQCPGCLEWVPLDQFCDLIADTEHDAIEPHCLKCRTAGPPEPKFLNLTARHRKAIEHIMAAPDLPTGYRNAAAATGYSRKYLYHLASGRRVPEFRRFFQLKLEAAGADINKVVSVCVDAMDADEHKWNPASEQFDAFADHRTRLRAGQHVGKMLELEPPKADGINVGVAIKIETNLGTGETHDPPNIMRPKPVTVEINPLKPVVDCSDAG
jgi:hypothetical protein